MGMKSILIIKLFFFLKSKKIFSVFYYIKAFNIDFYDNNNDSFFFMKLNFTKFLTIFNLVKKNLP